MHRYDFCLLAGFGAVAAWVVAALAKSNKRVIQTIESVEYVAPDKSSVVAMSTAATVTNVATIAGVGFCFNKLLRYLKGGVSEWVS